MVKKLEFARGGAGGRGENAQVMLMNMKAAHLEWRTQWVDGCVYWVEEQNSGVECQRG